MTTGRSVAVLLVVALATACLSATAPASASTRHPAVPHVIVDTDLSKWWDDVTALGIANVLQTRGKLEVLGIMSDVTNPIAVAAIDALDTAYGHPDIPIGAVAGSEGGTFDHGYTDTLVAKLPHSVRDSSGVPEAVALYRRLLEHAPDHSVTIVSLGGYTNLAGLLAASDGPKLISHKVKRLVIMDGFFPDGIGPVTNQLIDPAATSAVVTDPGWPGPIAWADGTVGLATRVGGSLCASVAPDHPMRVAYEQLFQCGPPKDGDWDAPTLLYAIGDHPGTFTELGQGGAAVVNTEGGLSWKQPSTRPHDVYVHVVDQAALNARIESLLSAR
jgi:hypothetical protein